MKLGVAFAGGGVKGIAHAGVLKALEEENVKRHMEGKEVVKVIVIKGKIVNIVVK